MRAQGFEDPRSEFSSRMCAAYIRASICSVSSSKTHLIRTWPGPPLLARRPLTLLSSKIWLRPFSRFCHARYFSRRGTEVVIKISSCLKLVQRLEREIFSLGSAWAFLDFFSSSALAFPSPPSFVEEREGEKEAEISELRGETSLSCGNGVSTSIFQQKKFLILYFLLFPSLFPLALSLHFSSFLACMAEWIGVEMHGKMELQTRLSSYPNLQTCSVSHFRAWNSRRRSFSSAQLL